jgi:hypothetical protein
MLACVIALREFELQSMATSTLIRFRSVFVLVQVIPPLQLSSILLSCEWRTRRKLYELVWTWAMTYAIATPY